MFDFNHLRILVHIVEGGSLSAAARRLEMPVSKVSRALAHLEQIASTRLLNRTTRAQSLTYFGEQLYQRSAAAVHELENAQTEMLSQNGQPEGTVRVATTSGFWAFWVIPVLDAFFRRYPKIRIETQLTEQRVDPAQAEVDFVIRMGDLSDSDMLSRGICDIDRILVASPSYLRGQPKIERPGDLEFQECIVQAASLSDWAFANGETIRVPWRSAVGNIVNAKEMALRGHGVALLPQRVVQDELVKGQLEQLLSHFPLPKARATALFTQNKARTLAASVLIEYLADNLSW